MAAPTDFAAPDSAGAQRAGYDYYNYTSINGAPLNTAPVNAAPVAVGETFAGGLMNAAVVIPFAAILKNDYDANGDTLRLAEITAASHGQVVIDWDKGQVIFTPDEGFTGTANFEYRITDDKGGYADAAMKIAVNETPIAAADGITILEDGGATDYNQSFGTIIQAETVFQYEILTHWNAAIPATIRSSNMAEMTDY